MTDRRGFRRASQTPAGASGRVRRTPRGRLGALGGLGIALVLLLTGCVSMPSSGPVVEAEDALSMSPDSGIAIAPRPPDPGASPGQIVQGFLDAMRATPVQTSVAAEYLLSSARSSWDPGRELITYTERTQPAGADPVSVELIGAEHLDDRGRWLGDLPEDRTTLTFPMVREDGEWRISEAPDALVVPGWWFDSRYRQVSLYFFDPTAEILVPEPVFVARGSSLATELVRGLAQGPAAGATGVARTYFPAGVSEGLSVPVSSDGKAEVALTGVGATPTTETVDLMSAQLAWTLRQDPSVSTVRLSVDGEPMQSSGGRSEFSVEDSPEVDPAGYQPSPYLFAERGGVLATGEGAGFEPVVGTLGRIALDWRSQAVDLGAVTAAGVSGDGRSLQIGPVRADGPATTVVSDGQDLLRPVWDAHGRLWVVDRTSRGAVVTYFLHGERRRVQVPGVSGQRVRSVLVSRDGSRLVAVVRRSETDRIVVSRLRVNDSGQVFGATEARQISDETDGAPQIRDLAWLSPTSILVLHQFGTNAQIRTVSVDGSHSGFDSVSLTLPTEVSSLASSPVTASARYAVTEGTLRGLTPDDPDWDLPEDVRRPDYVG
ncbi:LpqB family beta-propeller domain-containing protein [Nocardioides insulae]|uniref:LpqB family beta-propeller domain-containing protein n=1 Tax=Nocardioides insulae TaxID=394734 RepID=UPI00041381BA|nr:LpqB family beta-propeller domain-containing protein [Nocardioides insulae]